MLPRELRYACDRKKATHIADHSAVVVGTSLVQGSEDDFQVLRHVVFGMQQQHRQQLRCLYSGPRHPVGEVVAHGRKDLGQVSEDELPTAQHRAVFWRWKEQAGKSPSETTMGPGEADSPHVPCLRGTYTLHSDIF